MSIVGLVLRLFLFFVPVGLLGWAGVRKLHPLIKGMKRLKKPADKGKSKSMKEAFKSARQS